ncbi:MAG: hypothetical protein WB347_16275 [Terriglobales bacterium]
MVIDWATHRKWVLVSAGGVVIAAVAYVPHAMSVRTKPFGGTGAGIAYGAVGLALMIFAGLLGAREKVPAWRVGRMQAWMRAHLWLGLLSFPVILFHAAFSFGHGLTWWLMVIFTVVTASGIAGALLQQYLPRMMTRQVPLETTFEQIDDVREQLIKEAEELVTAACAPPKAAPAAKTEAAAGAAVATAAPPATSNESAARLQSAWESTIRMYLEQSTHIRQGRVKSREAQHALRQLRTLLPPAMHDTVAALEDICVEAGQLRRQTILHYGLHGWLMVHIPLSYALLALSAVHAVMALRY